MQKTLIVFDLDGTLVDSQQDLANSANVMLDSYGAGPLAIQEVAAMVGDGTRQLVARALSAAGVDADVSEALDRFLEAYAERLVEHTQPYDGIPEALGALADQARLAVLTNKPQRLTGPLLDHFGLAAYFEWVVGADAAFPRKPDPASLQYLVREAAVLPDATIMVGDSLVDVQTARAAGTRVCLAAYGFGHLRRPIELRPGELVASHSTDLQRVLEEGLARS